MLKLHTFHKENIKPQPSILKGKNPKNFEKNL